MRNATALKAAVCYNLGGLLLSSIPVHVLIEEYLGLVRPFSLAGWRCLSSEATSKLEKTCCYSTTQQQHQHNHKNSTTNNMPLSKQADAFGPVAKVPRGHEELPPRSTERQQEYNSGAQSGTQYNSRGVLLILFVLLFDPNPI